jgi:predicted short-subunit dehydrogenase-like oxidoreductase (DUF2520 family)
MKKLSISIIGSGNAAFTLSGVLVDKGFDITQIVSRNIKEAKKLASITKSKPASFNEIDLSVDAILLCIADDAIAAVSKQLKKYEGVMMHCSGSIAIDALVQKNAAVLYPFVSMKKGNKIDLSNTNIFIEAKSPNAKKVVSYISKKISNNVQAIDSNQRQNLHLAAVFAQNFVNHQMHLAQIILEQNGMDFKILSKLIVNYFELLKQNTPDNIQTGPAVRKDEDVIKKHLSLLQTQPELKKIYQLMTTNIQKLNSND